MGNKADNGALGVLRPSGGSSPEGELPEFDAFLAQIGYGHLYRHCRDEAEEEAPVAPVRVVAPLEKPERKSRHVGGWLWALSMAVVVATLLWTPLQHVYAQWAAKMAKVNAGPSYAFLERFNDTRPGTKVRELRDRLGLPMSRHSRVGLLHQEEWIYAAISDKNPAEKLMCILTLRSGRVMWKKKVAVPASSVTATGRMDEASTRVGDLWLGWPDGSRERAQVSDDVPCVFLNPVAGMELGELSALPARVLMTRCGGGVAAGTNAKGATVLRADDGSPLVLPPVSVYWRGTLHFLPFGISNVSKDTVKADLEWLLARLLAKRQSA